MTRHTFLAWCGLALMACGADSGGEQLFALEPEPEDDGGVVHSQDSGTVGDSAVVDDSDAHDGDVVHYDDASIDHSSDAIDASDDGDELDGSSDASPAEDSGPTCQQHGGKCWHDSDCCPGLGLSCKQYHPALPDFSCRN